MGLVQREGRTYIVRFSCPLEALPPRGTGDVLTSDGAALSLEDGQLTYRGEPVVIGHEE